MRPRRSHATGAPRRRGVAPGDGLLGVRLYLGQGSGRSRSACRRPSSKSGIRAGLSAGLAVFACVARVVHCLPRFQTRLDRARYRFGPLVGSLLAAGLIVQHVGLDQTSEAVARISHQPDDPVRPVAHGVRGTQRLVSVLWIGVVLATLGVWLMTGAEPHSLGLGEILGLASRSCSRSTSRGKRRLDP